MLIAVYHRSGAGSMGSLRCTMRGYTRRRRGRISVDYWLGVAIIPVEVELTCRLFVA
jgi:hypothetical protein